MNRVAQQMASLAKGLKSLSRKMERLSQKIEGTAQPRQRRKPAPVKKPAKKPTPAKTRTSPGTTAPRHLSVDLLQLIRSSAEGMTTGQIIKRTGLSERQVWGIVARAKKAGKLKTGRRGLYIAS